MSTTGVITIEGVNKKYYIKSRANPGNTQPYLEVLIDVAHKKSENSNDDFLSFLSNVLESRSEGRFAELEVYDGISFVDFYYKIDENAQIYYKRESDASWETPS